MTGYYIARSDHLTAINSRIPAMAPKNRYDCTIKVICFACPMVTKSLQLFIIV